MSDFANDTQFDISVLVSLREMFFDRPPEIVAPDLLGCVVATYVDGVLAAGVVVETEAYLGSDDPGSHAATKGMTARNSVMYGPPGTAYVYFTYGNHHMLNLVCASEGVAGAVLVRALRPVLGIEAMTSRRHGRPVSELCNGPGKLAEALGIDLSDNRALLGSGRITVYDGDLAKHESIANSGRVGLTRGHELQLRYYIEGDPFVSRARTGPLASKRRGEARQKGSR